MQQDAVAQAIESFARENRVPIAVVDLRDAHSSGHLPTHFDTFYYGVIGARLAKWIQAGRPSGSLR